MHRKVTHSCSESVPRDYQLDSDPDTQTHTQNVTGCTNACRRLPGVEPLVSRTKAYYSSSILLVVVVLHVVEEFKALAYVAMLQCRSTVTSPDARRLKLV